MLTPSEIAVIEQMPKAELHVHLEGAVRPRTLLELGAKHGVALPFHDEHSAREFMRFRDFAHFIDVFEVGLSVLLDQADFERITWELAQDAAAQHIVYQEVIISPAALDDPRNSAHPDLVLAGCRAGASRAWRELGVRQQFLLDAVRVRPVASVRKLAAWCIANQGDGLVGFGLGGTEVGHPAAVHAEALARAKAAGLGISVHAGETVGPESVWDALQCGSDRIGHGVTSVLDPALLTHLAEQRIPLEVSPTSNVLLGVAPSLAEHQMRALHDAGVVLTLNTDDPQLFDVTLTDEFLNLAEEQAFTLETLVAINLNAVDAAFLPESTRRQLRQTIEDATAELLASAGVQWRAAGGSIPPL